MKERGIQGRRRRALERLERGLKSDIPSERMLGYRTSERMGEVTVLQRRLGLIPTPKVLTLKEQVAQREFGKEAIARIMEEMADE